jgi:hypothetical protein
VNPRNDNVYAKALALEERRRQRTRRRLGAWGAFLLLGLLIGAVYATGFATIGAGTPSESTPESLAGEPQATQAENSALKNSINPVTTELTYSWLGRWGSIETAVMYELDLEGTDPVDEEEFTASDKFYSEVVLLNEPTGFSDLQLQLRIAKLAEPSSESCALNGEAALKSAVAPNGGGVVANQRVMHFDTSDAQVLFKGINDSSGAATGLPGAAEYCVGLVNYTGPPEAGKDELGTFIRKNKTGPEFDGEEPEFVVTLNRM